MLVNVNNKLANYLVNFLLSLTKLPIDILNRKFSSLVQGPSI